MARTTSRLRHRLFWSLGHSRRLHRPWTSQPIASTTLAAVVALLAVASAVAGARCVAWAAAWQTRAPVVAASVRSGRNIHPGTIVSPGLAGRLRKMRLAPRVRLHAVAFDKDPWKVLGLEKSASQSEIKRAYRRRALKDHPDVNKAPDAKERWQELSQAYDILSDPAKRQLWEARRGAGGTPRGGAGARSGWRGGPTPKGPRERALDEEYDAGGDSFGSIFGDFLEGLGKEVGGSGSSSVGSARKAGAYVLEELLDFLEGRGGKAASWDGSQPEEELKMAREELETLQKLEGTMRAESETWTKQAEVARSSGDRQGELDAMQKAFDARERRSNVRRRVVRAEERVEYLEKVIFEQEKKRQQRPNNRQQGPIDSPGMYNILHDRTKVAPTKELSEQWVAELDKGAAVRVVEVISMRAIKRVRGRLESPAGWISLLNTETGYRWAAKPSSTGSSSSSSQSRPPPPPTFDAESALQELKRKKAGQQR